MTNTGRRHPPDRTRSVIFALIGATFASAACAGQPAETAPPQAASDVVAQAVAPGDGSNDEARALTPLGQAALYGDIETARRQLREGADVDATSGGGMTPLMLSFQPLILPSKVSGPDPEARRASLARKTRKLQIVRLLLDSGADLTLANSNGMTALHFLVLMYTEEPPLIETLQAFMAKGADPNVSNINGQTPLMFAAYRNRFELVKALLSAGADPKAAAKDGRTALSIARERGHAAVAELLERKLQ